MSLFASVEMTPGDPILGLVETFMADPRPGKINLGIGVYLDEQGRIPLLPTVHEVEQALALSAAPRGYLPIDGLPAYNRLTQQLLFGAQAGILAEGRVATAQTIGGSAALRVGADVLKQVLGERPRVALSNPSWENHAVVFRAAGFEVGEYRYFDPASHGLDFAGMLDDLGRLEHGSVVLLHACCHNPTGVDLDQAQWEQVISVLDARGLLPFLDMAYQGFDQGLEQDAQALRLLAKSPIRAFVVANSYSKSFSLYGERVGALSMAGTDREEATRLLSKMKQTIRSIYSSPATHGGALVAGVLGSADLRARWEAELGAMRSRIHAMRAGLVTQLAAHGATQFAFINRQAGMFSYSGLSVAQVRRLRDEFAIYALDNGRICLAALSQDKLDAVAAAMATVSR
ncbi:MAG: amino acid aminotransferase [Rhodanobacter sp.]